MTLQELWAQLIRQADPGLAGAISYFSGPVQSLSDDLPPYLHHEFPKWVGGVLVQDEAQEAALTVKGA